MPDACLRADVQVASHEGSVTLLRLREQDGSGLVRVFIDSTDHLKLRADLSDVTYSVGGTKLPPGWSTLELCGLTSTGTVSGALNGVSLGSYPADFGLLGTGRLQIGDDNEKTVTYNFDDVVAEVPPAP